MNKKSEPGSLAPITSYFRSNYGRGFAARNSGESEGISPEISFAANASTSAFKSAGTSTADCIRIRFPYCLMSEGSYRHSIRLQSSI